ncbi:g5187 [Coccomyxa viridis]|uniref:Protein arginine N-methyltransferase n=1 Tax=Coccomyxa viridis TaxID=1274662 RepID=A0ABP1FS66_9CHLO
MPLGKRTDCGDAKYSGVQVPFAADINSSLQEHLDAGFDFITAPLISPDAVSQPVPPDSIQLPYSPTDILLVQPTYSNQVVGVTSHGIEPDSEAPDARLAGAKALRLELEWASHMSLQACILPLPQLRCNAHLACILNQVLNGLSNTSIWVQIPLSSQSEAAADNSHSSGDSWRAWNEVRCLCNHSTKLGVILEVQSEVPRLEEVLRWHGEPVKALLLPTSAFLTNRRGYPTLSKAHQELLTRFFQLGVQVVLSGESRHSHLGTDTVPSAQNGFPSLSESSASGTSVPVNGVSAHPLQLYCEYLSYVFRRPQLPQGQEEMEIGYRDYLQVPLQPLQDNLELQTYETFERDTPKYAAYEQAVHDALLDRVPQSEAATRTTVLMVVGAGRGPLVRAALNAARQTERRLKIYAIEKNPNAVVTLHKLVAAERWEDQVTVVAVDMRSWQAPEQADILVSELLGSFGDNELSPECLDGAQRFLRSGGISIPCAYTSHLQPITSAKLWSEVQGYNDLEHYETPYVVKMHRFTPLSAPQPVFSFHHPSKEPRPDNTRSISLAFPRDGSPEALCHGLAGYFDTQLYGQVTLSIHPQTHTEEMHSWFPIYFPFKAPVHCPAGAAIQVHMWRCSANHKVWYEWAMTAPSVTTIHNPNGRSYHVGL